MYFEALVLGPYMLTTVMSSFDGVTLLLLGNIFFFFLYK